METITTLRGTPTNPNGETDVELLTKKTGDHENENESCKWVEYWDPFATVAIDPDTQEQMLSWPTDPLDPDGPRSFKVYPPAGEGVGFHPPIVHDDSGVCVHRSAHTTLKAVPEDIKTMLGELVRG